MADQETREYGSGLISISSISLIHFRLSPSGAGQSDLSDLYSTFIPGELKHPKLSAQLLAFPKSLDSGRRESTVRDYEY